MYDPWAVLAQHPEWRLRRDHPLEGGMLGCFDPDTGTIFLDPSLGQAARRCTLAHEIEHALAGDTCTGFDFADDEAERLAATAAARKLIDIRDLAEAELFDRSPESVAEALWVDLDTLRLRVETLEPQELAYLRRRIRGRDEEWGAA